MFIDALTKVATAQAFGAAGVSASSLDLGLTTPGRQVGTGEPISALVTVDVAATVAPPIIEIISATDAALTAGILSHAQRTPALAEAVAGSIWELTIPMGTPTQRFLGVRITTAGGTITASASFQPRDMASIAPRNYNKGYTV
jgi:hypothetical protein